MNQKYLFGKAMAMKSRLLSKDELSYLAKMKDVREISRYLLKTDYGKEIRRFMEYYKGFDLVDVAIVNNFGRNLLTIYKGASQQDRERLKPLLMRATLHNIYTIIRGKKAKIPLKKVFDLFIPAPFIDQELSRSLYQMPLDDAMFSILRILNLKTIKNTKRKDPEDIITLKYLKMLKKAEEDPILGKIYEKIGIIEEAIVLLKSPKEYNPLFSFWKKNPHESAKEVINSLYKIFDLKAAAVEELYKEAIRSISNYAKLENIKKPASLAGVAEYILLKEVEIRQLREIAYNAAIR